MMHMPKWYFSRTTLSFWFEEHTRTFIVVGVVLLVLGLIILVMKRAHIFPFDSGDGRKHSFRLPTAGLEKGALPMTPGLREDRKITEYEWKKRAISTLFTMLGLLAFVIFVVLVLLNLASLRTGIGLVSALYMLALCIGLEIALAIAKVMLCIMCDHIIEMCYANQYRAMRDNPVISAPTAPVGVAKETSEEQREENKVGD